MKSDSLTREEMLIYLKAFGRYAPEYYEKLDDKTSLSRIQQHIESIKKEQQIHLLLTELYNAIITHIKRTKYIVTSF